MTPKQRIIGANSVILEGDARELIRGLPKESVHLTLTSPPYHDHKVYGDKPAQEDLGAPRPYQEYLSEMAELFRELARATAPGGKCLLQSANMKRANTGNPSVTPIHWDLTRLLMEAGFIFYDEICWLKKSSYTGSVKGRPLFGSYPMPGNPKMMNQLWEDISVMLKPGDPPKMAAPKPWENLSVMHKPGDRPPRTEENRRNSRLTWEEWREWTHGIWRIESRHDPDHPATFNPELAERVIRLYSFAGETVLDPFAGTGTTVIAAERLGRAGIGFELRRKYCIVAANRGAQLLQLDMFQKQEDRQGRPAQQPLPPPGPLPGQPEAGEDPRPNPA